MKLFKILAFIFLTPDVCFCKKLFKCAVWIIPVRHYPILWKQRPGRSLQISTLFLKLESFSLDRYDFAPTGGNIKQDTL